MVLYCIFYTQRARSTCLNLFIIHRRPCLTGANFVWLVPALINQVAIQMTVTYHQVSHQSLLWTLDRKRGLQPKRKFSDKWSFSTLWLPKIIFWLGIRDGLRSIVCPLDDLKFYNFLCEPQPRSSWKQYNYKINPLYDRGFITNN